MPAVWLRDNCPCPLCRDPVSGQRLLHITDIPAVLAVAASLGYVRETNYGRLFDVRVESPPSNLAFTSLPIPPHTDNPYRDAATELSAPRPLISLDPQGRIREIQINPRSLQPVRLPRISMASSRPWRWENVRQRAPSAGRTGHDSSRPGTGHRGPLRRRRSR
jgi:hypothetical protein